MGRKCRANGLMKGIDINLYHFNYKFGYLNLARLGRKNFILLLGRSKCAMVRKMVQGYLLMIAV